MLKRIELQFSNCIRERQKERSYEVIQYMNDWNEQMCVKFHVKFALKLMLYVLCGVFRENKVKKLNNKSETLFSTSIEYYIRLRKTSIQQI